MSQHARRMRYWQALTIGLLVIGYAGYYLCRSNLSVALPLIIADFGARGLNQDEMRIQLGTMASLGVLAYALGKFLSGGLADFLGGRRNFLLGMTGSIFFTIAFALGGAMPVFTLSWIGNRLVQSLGWAGLVKITSKWFSFSTYGTVMGAMSLSYLFGDAAARQFMGMLIARDFDWRSVFWAGASALLVLLVVNLWLLKESPTEIGRPEPPASPLSLFGNSGLSSGPPSLRELLAPLLTSPAFWLVCLLSLGCTLVRETFNIWTPTYFTQVVGLSNARAAKMSALFPLFGGASVLLAGYLSDRLGQQGRATVILGGLSLAALALFALGHVEPGGTILWPVGLVTLVAFLTIGPYSYLAGAIALDFGGKQGSATFSGIIDGIGYLGGVLAGDSIARVSVAYSWKGVFLALSGVTLLSCLAAAVFRCEQSRCMITQGSYLRRAEE